MNSNETLIWFQPVVKQHIGLYNTISFLQWRPDFLPLSLFPDAGSVSEENGASSQTMPSVLYHPNKGGQVCVWVSEGVDRHLTCDFEQSGHMLAHPLVYPSSTSFISFCVVCVHQLFVSLFDLFSFFVRTVFEYEGELVSSRVHLLGKMLLI